MVFILSPFAVLMSQKKSSFGNFFEQIKTENQQQINTEFRKVLRKFQQQINRAITELDFFWDINTANGDNYNIVIKFTFQSEIQDHRVTPQ
tara:strand:+ start:405 stop:677 length:273 start_codon:yes stop_codon:yes gene_type:complete